MHVRSTVIVILWTLHSLPLAAIAKNDIFIVPQNISELQIPEFRFSVEDLLENDSDGTQIASFTSTSRGELEHDPSGAAFYYKPGDEFWRVGMDSFRYVSAQSGSAIVFLIYDKYNAPEFTIDSRLVTTLSPRMLIIHDGSIGPVDQGEIKMTTVGEVSLEARITRTNKPGNSGGGKIGGDLDPITVHQLSQEVPIAVVNVGGEAKIELILKSGDVHPLLQARGRPEPGVVVATDWVPLRADSPQFVAASWWPKSGDGAMDGGLALEFNGRVVASVPNLGFPGSLVPAECNVRFGALGTANFTGTLELERIRFWETAEERLPFSPIFADGVEGSDLSAWQAVAGSPSVTASSAIHGDWGLKIPSHSPSYLVDGSPADETHYLARFSLDPRDLELGSDQQLTVLGGFGNSLKRFAVKLRRQSDTLELCAEAYQNSGSPVGANCSSLTPENVYSVRAFWWTSSSNGGLKLFLRDLTLDSDEQTVVYVSGLENDGQILDQVRFGALDPPVGTAGNLYLDDFESWR